MSTKLNTSKRNTQQRETKLQSYISNGCDPFKKQRNIPAEIWAKRNVLKKLTLQLKFNKNQTHQYKKIRTQTNDQKIDQTQAKSIQLVEENHITNEIFSSSNKKSMKKLSTAKAQNIVKYTDNFFASNVFSVNGLKSYHYKSASFQGNNFINVSKAVIVQKKNEQNTKSPTSHRRKSFSHRQRHEGDQKKEHRRSSSSSGNYLNIDKDEVQRRTDFLKVSSKRMHLICSDICLPDEAQGSSKVFMKRPKTQINQSLTLSFSKQKINQNQKKNHPIRPKSCIIKTKKFTEFESCEGWNTKNSAREQQGPFPIFFRF